MNPKKVRLIIAAIAISIIALLPAAAFYGRYEILSNRLENELGLDGGTANAVKHAYAAAELYYLVATVLPDRKADSLVTALGVMNEYIERITKLRKPDSLREVMKDLHNNRAGIAAAKWQKRQGGKGDLLAIILRMAKDRVLIVARDQNPFYKDEDQNNSTVVGTARDWLESLHDKIDGRISANFHLTDL